MRVLLLLPLAALAACSSFNSPCENINADQDDLALQTCVFSASVEEDSDFSSEDGAPVAFSVPEPVSFEGAFPDGARLVNGTWVAPGAAPPAKPDSARAVSTSAIAPGATHYAVGMRWAHSVLLLSASGQSLATVRVADGLDEKMERSLGTTDWPNRATHLAYSPDGTVLYGADTQGNVTAWNATSGETLWTAAVALDHGGEDGRAITPDGIRALVPSGDGAHIAIATSRGVHVMGAAMGETLAMWVFPGTRTSVVSVGFAEGDRHVVVKTSGRYMAPSVRYSSFDENGQRTPTPFKSETEARQNPPTVFLMALP